jgi:hypothetical protein
MIRSLAFLLSLFCSVQQSFCQTEAELTEQGKLGREVLVDHGINSRCFTITNTPQGLFIGGRDDANAPLNYLYAEGNDFQKIDRLTGYVIFAYSPIKNELLVGKYERGNTDSMCREIYTYSLGSKRLLVQLNLGWIYGSPKYNEFYDSLVIVVNVKNVDGIGSHYATKSIKVK